MISRCTYLKDELALPKGSFIGELYSILTEINNFSAFDNNGEKYYLTQEDKIKIIDELFFKQESVELSEIKELLCLTEYGSKNQKNFNNKFTIYTRIANIIPKLQFSSIKDVVVAYLEKDEEVLNKINTIENIIADINLFNEEKSKREYFRNNKEYDFSEDQAFKLAKLQSNGSYSVSKKFIDATEMNAQCETVIQILFSDNKEGIVNNLETIKANATDKDGNKIEFISAKYKEILKNNDCKLNINLLIDGNKAFMPVSRSVVRALNETLKVY